MALIVGGTTVTGTQTLEASTLTGTASAINGSNITNLPSPDTDTQGAVGTYGLGKAYNYTGSWSPTGTTTSVFRYVSLGGDSSSTQSGTWRAHGSVNNNNANGRSTLWIRIS